MSKRRKTEAKIDFIKVMTLKDLRDKSTELAHTMEELSKPILDDLNLLPIIYEVFCNCMEKRFDAPAANSVYQRKKFLLVVMYLYSPRTLAGGKMRLGLRDELSRLLGLNAKTPISDNCSDVVTLYKTYRDFRRDVDLIYDAVVRKLQDMNLVFLVA